MATGSQLGLLGNRNVMDTPFNQTSYTAKKAKDQQAQTVRDVLIDDPSVRSWLPDGGGGCRSGPHPRLSGRQRDQRPTATSTD